ncbi:MAG TPA: glycosyltransferase [Myxococcales bacterium]|jgi:glycosyltransferase involved in cell wall biosynthesis
MNSGSGLKVLFCVRRDLHTVGGGDATQILRTRDALQALGVQVQLWSEPHAPARGSYDLAHLFHLTRLDTFVHAQALATAGLPFVLSTIHWPMAEFEQQGHIGPLRLLHRALSSGPADVAKNGVRALLADGPWRAALLASAPATWNDRIGFLLAHARCLLPNSKAEADVLSELGQTARIEPVVNATEPPPADAAAAALPRGLPPRFVLAAGRIEPRKNQLALVEALGGFPVPLVLVGDPGPMHPNYLRRVRTAATRTGAMLLPAQPRPVLFSLLARAEAHLAPAWYETPGLVSLEAAAAGTRIVTTDRGCTREYFGPQASYLDPADAASMRAAAESALAQPKDDGLRQRVLREFTWARAGEQTLAAYRSALGDREVAA